MKTTELNEMNLEALSSEEMNTTNGGCFFLPAVGAAIIAALWEIYDSPADYNSGFKAGYATTATKK